MDVESVHAASQDDEPFTDRDRRAIAASREWFRKNPEGISFEQAVVYIKDSQMGVRGKLSS